MDKLITKGQILYNSYERTRVVKFIQAVSKIVIERIREWEVGNRYTVWGFQVERVLEIGCTTM